MGESMIDMVMNLSQLGAVGVIAAALVWETRETRKTMAQTNLEHQQQMAKRLASLETELITLVRNNTAAMRDVSHALQAQAERLDATVQGGRTDK